MIYFILINGIVSSSGFVNPDDSTELYTATQRFRKLTDGSATVSGRISVNAVGTPIVIIFEGKDNKAIKLTANDNTSCKIEADLDGDGNFDDYIADPVAWDDL